MYQDEESYATYIQAYKQFIIDVAVILVRSSQLYIVFMDQVSFVGGAAVLRSILSKYSLLH